MEQAKNLFSLKGVNVVITGSAGVLCSVIAEGLGRAGANIAICDLVVDKAENLADRLNSENMSAKSYEIDVLDKSSIETCLNQICMDFDNIGVLINGAGGNMKGATTSEDLSFFDLQLDDLEKVVGLNLFGGAILPSQVFGKKMVENKNGGSIINISSMNAFRPLTRIPGYSAAKAAVSNFTQWLAVHFAREYNPDLRVNAIAPGFFLTEQNRFLVTDEKTGELTGRGKRIIDHTPQNRFGDPDDLIGTVIWLASNASKFVTGIIVPVDGGFSAFSGV